MTSQFTSHDVGAVLPPDAWSRTAEFRGVRAHVETLPDAEEMADALGLNGRAMRTSAESGRRGL